MLYSQKWYYSWLSSNLGSLAFFFSGNISLQRIIMEEVILVEIVLGLYLSQSLSSAEAPCGFLDQLIVNFRIIERDLNMS